MKKCNWKRALALGLVVVMTLSMAGCKKKGEGGGIFGGSQGGGSVTADPSLAKQNVYRYQELDFGKEQGDDFNMNVIASAVSGEKVYLLSNEYTYDLANDQYTSALVLYELSRDGSGAKEISMEKPVTTPAPAKEPGETSDSQPQQPVTGNVLEAEPVEEEQDAGGDNEDDEDFIVEDDYVDEEYNNEMDYYESAVISNDKAYAYRNHIQEAYLGGEYVSNSGSFIDCWDTSGKLLWEAPLDLSKYQNDETYSWVNGIMKLADGKIAVMMNGDQTGLIFVSEDGTISDLKKMSSDKDIFDRQAGSAACDDGTLLISYYDEEWSNQYLVAYDPAKNAFGTEYKVPDTAKAVGFYNFTSMDGKTVYFSNSDGVYKFALGDSEMTKVMDYVNSDLLVYGLQNLMVIDDSSFFASYNDTIDYQMHFCLFTYVKPEDIQEKKVLVYAGFYVDSDIKKMIIDFNKESTEYRITIRDYSMYNTSEDYTAGYTKFNNDIIAGNVADIMALSSEMPVDSYISKGLFANIDEMIKNDPDLSQIEFMDNVFEAYRVNGVLYRLIPKFYVKTFIGKKSLLGDRTSITMDELSQIAAGVSDKTSLFGMYTQESFVSSILQFGGGDFVDVNTGKCSFDSQLFISLLDFAKKLPTDEETWGDGYDEDFWEEYNEKYESQYRENRTLLMECNMYNLTSMKSNINGFFGEDVTYVGFPTEGGTGSSVEAISSFSIYSKSANKDGAWAFLRTLLMDSYQKNDEDGFVYSWGLPVNKAYLRQMADETTQKSYYIDYETGEKVEYDDTFWINGQDIPLLPLSKEQADKLFDFICSVNKAGYYSEEVDKIVSEEAEAFFSGQKSSKDTAAMIQNRVQLYVNENQ